MKSKKLTTVIIILGIILSIAIPFALSPSSLQAQTLSQAKTSLLRLHVKNGKLLNSDNKTVRLKGVSTHGIAWYPEYVNRKAFKTLKKDWKANVIRLALYTEEYGGYTTVNDEGKAKLEKIIDNGVKYAALNKMYVIIDWHILNDGNPNTHRKEAIKFFKKTAKKYKGYTNVIYEICNEPNGDVSWSKNIYPYATKVINAIRKYDTKAPVIVGTPTWSQDVDEVVSKPLKDSNVLYALHFYAGTHGDYLRDKADKALDANLAIIVSECNITDASGNGNINKKQGNAWMKWMKKNGISYVVWNLSNKNEDSALIKSSCTKKYGWKKKNLSTTGKWFKKKMRKG